MRLISKLLCGWDGHKGTYFLRYDKINKVRVLKCAYCGELIKERVYGKAQSLN